jgi:hypothetical protein
MSSYLAANIVEQQKTPINQTARFFQLARALSAGRCLGSGTGYTTSNFSLNFPKTSKPIPSANPISVLFSFIQHNYIHQRTK